MALNAKTIAAGVGDILNVDGGLTGSGKQVKDGDGTASPIYISTAAVGIGASSPGAKLHVDENDNTKAIALRVDTDNVLNYLHLVNNTNDSHFLFVNNHTIGLKADDSGTDGLIEFHTGGTSKMAINHAGNVGIGTGNPGVDLTVSDSTTSSSSTGGAIRLQSNDSAAATGDGHRLGVIEFAGEEDASDTMAVGAKIEAITHATWSGSERSTGLRFFVRDGSSALAEGMRITDTGKVGINETSPANLLHVSNSDAGGHASVEISRGNPAGSANVVFSSADDGYADWTIGSVDSDDFGDGTDFGIGTTLSAANVKLVIKSNGRVGIGATDPVTDLEIRSGGTTGGELALTLGDGDVGAEEIIGNIRFQAPKVGAGGDSIETVAYIRAISEGTFSATQNDTGLAFATAYDAPASEKMRISKHGKVGIGETEPDYRLHIKDGDSNGLLKFENPDAGGESYIMAISDDGGVAYGAAGTFSIRDSGNNVRLAIKKTSGNVGIGTTSPTKLLHLYNSVSADDTGINIQTSDKTAFLGYGGLSNKFAVDFDGPAIEFRAADASYASRMIIEDGGNVGIGTITPGALLELSSAAADSTILRLTNTASSLTENDTISAIQFYNSDITDDSPNIAASIYADAGPSGGSGKLRFHTTPVGSEGAAATATMTLDHGGRVGIGEDTPSQELHVKGSNDSAGALWTSIGPGNIPGVKVQNSSTSDGNYAGYFFENDTHVAGGIVMKFNTHTNDDSFMHFATSDTGATRNKMTIRNDGKVGIGTETPNSLLEINSGAAGDQTIDAAIANGLILSTGGEMGSTYKYYPAIAFRSEDPHLDANHKIGAAILARTQGAQGSSDDIGSYLQFATADTGDADPIVRMTIIDNGNISIGSDVLDPVTDLDIRGAGSNIGGELALTMADTAVGSGETLGTIRFQAPKVSAGGDSIETAAYIKAISSGTFSATRNDTALTFATAYSESATEKMRIDPNGNVGIGESSPGVELDVAGRVAIGNQTELTIASGAITITQSYHKVDTEGDASSDDLATINGGGTVGTILVLSAANDSRTVVVKNGTGNIVCGADFTLDNSSDTITLIWGGSQWMQISSSNNAA